MSLKSPEVNSGPSQERRSKTARDLHERSRQKQSFIWLPLVFYSLRHDGANLTRPLFPL